MNISHRFDNYWVYGIGAPRWIILNFGPHLVINDSDGVLLCIPVALWEWLTLASCYFVLPFYYFLQDLLRLTAYNQNHEQLPNTDFFITENDLDSFEIRVENGE